MIQRNKIITGSKIMTGDVPELEIRRHYWEGPLDEESNKTYGIQSPRVETRTSTAQQTFPSWKPGNPFEHVDTAAGGIVSIIVGIIFGAGVGAGVSAGGTDQIWKRNTRGEHAVYVSQF